MPSREFKEKTIGGLGEWICFFEGEYSEDVPLCQLGETRRVEDGRGGLRQRGVAVTGGFRHMPVPQSVP
jgi:hypothetical protein